MPRDIRGYCILFISLTLFFRTVEDELDIAAVLGDVEGVQRLIRDGADVNKKNQSGDTALMAAVAANDPVVVEILLDKRADVNAKSKEGGSA